MLSLSMLCANDNLEALDKHTGVYITHETHPGGEKFHSTFSSTPLIDYSILFTLYSIATLYEFMYYNTVEP